jgi:hypothetical protein
MGATGNFFVYNRVSHIPAFTSLEDRAVGETHQDAGAAASMSRAGFVLAVYLPVRGRIRGYFSVLEYGRRT